MRSARYEHPSPYWLNHSRTPPSTWCRRRAAAWCGNRSRQSRLGSELEKNRPLLEPREPGRRTEVRRGEAWHRADPIPEPGPPSSLGPDSQNEAPAQLEGEHDEPLEPPRARRPDQSDPGPGGHGRSRHDGLRPRSRWRRTWRRSRRWTPRRRPRLPRRRLRLPRWDPSRLPRIRRLRLQQRLRVQPVVLEQLRLQHGLLPPTTRRTPRRMPTRMAMGTGTPKGLVLTDPASRASSTPGSTPATAASGSLGPAGRARGTWLLPLPRGQVPFDSSLTRTAAHPTLRVACRALL